MATLATFSGGGTPTGDTVAGIIEQAWEAAVSAQDEAADYAGDAVSASKAGFSPDFSPIDLDPAYDTTEADTRAQEKLAVLDADVNKVLNTTVPNNYDKLYRQLVKSTDLRSIFEGTFDADDLMKLVSTLSTAFNDTFMFGGDSLNQSLNKISDLMWDSINGNGLAYGLPTNVEDALQARTNDRSNAEIVKAENDIVATFASRGFPSPPGMAMRSMQEIQEKAIAERGATNREIFVDQARRGFDANQRFVDTFRDIQKQGQDSFFEYLEACLKAKSQSTDDMDSLIDAIVKLRSSVIGLYDYVDKEKDVYLREAIAQYELKHDQVRISSDLFRSRIDGQINATISAAQSMGQLAAAALGSQNTMASLAEETITEG